MRNKSVPKLTLSPSDAINKYVTGIPKSQRDRSPILITLIAILVVPTESLGVSACVSAIKKAKRNNSNITELRMPYIPKLPVTIK